MRRGRVLGVILALCFLAGALGGGAGLLLAASPRTTVLAMGMDRRADEPTRTDTMLLVSLDPAHRADFMLSLPRDLWITIPGQGPGRINEAYAIGGPSLSVLSASQLTGAPVDRWIVINFAGFKDVVDAMGGVTVDVAQTIDDPTYPADTGNGYSPFHLDAGRQHLDGATALRYVRSRHDDPEGDIGRTRRQQQVLEALAQQARSPANWWRLPLVARAAFASMQTDMSPLELARFGVLAARRDLSSFQTASLDLAHGYVGNLVTAGGAQVLQPNVPAIRRLVAGLEAGIGGEAASVRVLNGTATPGLAARFADQLAVKGVDVTAVGNASRDDVATTRIEQNSVAGPSARTAAYLATILHAPVVRQDQPGSRVALTVVLGRDSTR